MEAGSTQRAGVEELHPDADVHRHDARGARGAERLAAGTLGGMARRIGAAGPFRPRVGFYDVAHEYDHDWTTDPDYGAEGAISISMNTTRTV